MLSSLYYLSVFLVFGLNLCMSIPHAEQSCYLSVLQALHAGQPLLPQCFICLLLTGVGPTPHVEKSVLPHCVAGVGSCLVYVPSHVLSGLYYQRHQSLATGIATSGSGLGGAIMPIIFGKLIQIYGWKGSLIVVAGLQLHLIVFAALLRSPPVDKSLQTNKNCETKALLGEEKSTCETKPAAAVAKDAQGLAVQEETTCEAKSVVPEDSKALLVGSEPLATRSGALAINDDECKKLSQVNALGFSPNGREPLRESFSAGESGKKTCCDSALSFPTEDADCTDPINNSKQAEKTGFISNKVPANVEKIKNVEPRNPESEKMDMLLTDNDDIKVLHHVYLFTDVGFDVFFISNMLWNATAAMVLAFGPEFTTECGISDMNSAWLLAILGLGDFVGGIIGGVIGNIWVRHRQTQYIVANILFGVCVAMFPFGSTFDEFVAIMLSAGLVFGVVLGLLVVVLIDLIGTNSLGDGLGYIMLANGMGAFAGPGLTGTFTSCHFILMYKAFIPQL